MEMWKEKALRLGRQSGKPTISAVKALMVIFPHEEACHALMENSEEYKDFMKSTKSFLEFLQKEARAGYEEGDTQRFNGIINFCESFLIRNHLSEKNNEEVTK